MQFDCKTIAPKLAGLASRNILIGTSSWKYEGWIGQLYSPERYEFRGKIAKKRFEADCLTEYSEVFQTVCVDASYYRFPDERFIARLADQVPTGFRLGFKATDEITIKKFPAHARHGLRAGKANENFLNAPLFVRAFLNPLERYRDKTGVIMFEFSQFYPSDFERGRDFVDALDQFLGQLPTHDWQFGVELRNPGFLQPDYFEMLSSHNVAHVFNAWSRMPEVGDQIALDGSFTADFFAARFLLRKDRPYQHAVDSFSPYREIRDPNPAGREAFQKLIGKETKRPSYIFVNNRFEGNALQTIAAVLGA